VITAGELNAAELAYEERTERRLLFAARTLEFLPGQWGFRLERSVGRLYRHPGWLPL
jgi:hypothetical protein